MTKIKSVGLITSIIIGFLFLIIGIFMGLSIISNINSPQLTNFPIPSYGLSLALTLMGIFLVIPPVLYYSRNK
jgi:divalent metal cation (Fe/Co/Zn/Cd) transporter